MTNQGWKPETATGSGKTGSFVRRDDEDRREVKRHTVALPAKVRIPLEEKGTGLLLTAKASIKNISRSGANVLIPKVKRQHIQMLMRKRRKLLMVFEPPGLEGSLVLSGEVVWVDYRADPETSHAHLGVHLTDETHPDERKRLGKFIAILEKQKGAPTR